MSTRLGVGRPVRETEGMSLEAVRGSNGARADEYVEAVGRIEHVAGAATGKVAAQAGPAPR